MQLNTERIIWVEWWGKPFLRLLSDAQRRREDGVSWTVSSVSVRKFQLKSSSSGAQQSWE